MKTFISKYCYNASDSEELRLTKLLLITIASCCSFCGLIWSLIYSSFFGFCLTTALPLLFVIIVIPSIFISQYARNYKILVHAQLICISCVPSLVQWNLGSIDNSGFVIAWCFLSPLGALIFLNEKYAKIWMLIFLLIVGVTVIVVPTFSKDGENVTENFRHFFYLMNIGIPSLLIFIATSYFLKGLTKQKERILILLKVTNEKKQKIEESLELEKELGLLKTSFVSTASHQFRTPLAVIQSNTELLEMFANTSENQEKYKKVTDRIIAAISKMTVLMDDVLILGKLTSGSIYYKSEELDVIDFCEKLAKEFNYAKVDERSVNVLNYGKPYSIHLDSKLLTQALSNLISNAFKYSVGKKKPELVIHFKPKELSLIIKDYGIGIPKEEISNLFQPFFRAKNVTGINGRGLGLSIAKEYIEINKGTIEAQSILGEGSCFKITFKRDKL
jgi:signal transduction histidine kinase